MSAVAILRSVHERHSDSNRFWTCATRQTLMTFWMIRGPWDAQSAMRFINDKIYTYISQLLIAVNPYKSLPALYSETTMRAVKHVAPYDRLLTQKNHFSPQHRIYSPRHLYHPFRRALAQSIQHKITP